MARRKKEPRHKGGSDFSFTIDATCIALCLSAGALQNLQSKVLPISVSPRPAIRLLRFRNPLSGIIGMAETSLEEDITTIRSYLRDILNCGQRISKIVKGLRSYCRIAKKEEQNLIDMNNVLEESLKMVRLAVKTSSVEVIKKFQPIDKVVTNLGEIQQVFTNLITNAFQAMEGKGGILTLSTRSLRDSVEVKVSDHGTGIPQEHLSKIFDPFFTTKKLGEDTGLGLNIVYRIVTKYGGTIDVESKEGLGSIFTLRSPKRRDEP